MLRLQLYLPNALRRGLADFLPVPPSFNWFFFGKKFFHPQVGQPILQVDKPCQFYCPESGESYRVWGPSTFLIVLEDDDRDSAREMCQQANLSGYAYRVRDVPAPMEPPVPLDVVFWVFPETLALVTDWKECKVLQYAARDPAIPRDRVQDLVERSGIAAASLFLMRQNGETF